MLWLIDSCQNNVSANQYHLAISRARVIGSSRKRVMLKLSADAILVFIGSRSQVRLLLWGEKEEVYA